MPVYASVGAGLVRIEAVGRNDMDEARRLGDSFTAGVANGRISRRTCSASKPASLSGGQIQLVDFIGARDSARGQRSPESDENVQIAHINARAMHARVRPCEIIAACRHPLSLGRAGASSVGEPDPGRPADKAARTGP